MQNLTGYEKILITIIPICLTIIFSLIAYLAKRMIDDVSKKIDSLGVKIDSVSDKVNSHEVKIAVIEIKLKKFED